MALRSLYFLGRGLRRRAYFGSLRQRCGFLPASFRQTVPGAIWLHAVSVGEVDCGRGTGPAIAPTPAALAGLRLRLHAWPDSKPPRQKLPELARVFYAPLDYVFAVRRVLRTLRPSLVIVMETEIWPNLFRETKRTGAGLLLINGRISDRALGRYRALRWFFGGVLAQVDLLLAQSEEMRQRWIRHRRAAREGARRRQSQIRSPAARRPRRNRPCAASSERLRPRAVWIAASTMPPAAAGDPDEDDAVIAAFRQVCARASRDLLLLLAPAQAGALRCGRAGAGARRHPVRPPLQA